jgi:hypothetical protein
MDLSLTVGQAEISRIEYRIRDLDLSLARITEDCHRLATQVAECRLMHRLLVVRPHTAESRSINWIHSDSGALRQRRARN